MTVGSQQNGNCVFARNMTAYEFVKWGGGLKPSSLIEVYAYEIICIIITTLIIHHSFTLSLQAQNLPFQQILPTVDFFYLLDSCLTITGLDRTYHAHHFIFSFTF